MTLPGYKSGRSSDNKVYDLYAAKGTEKWSFVTGNDVSSSSAVSPDGTTIFIGSWDNIVVVVVFITFTE